jgi:hypothetical protein
VKAVFCIPSPNYFSTEKRQPQEPPHSVEVSAEGSETRGYAFFLRAEMLTSLVYPSDEVHRAAVVEAMEALESAIECFLPMKNLR